MKYLKEEEGFTLIESMVAMVVLVIGISTLYNLHLAATRGNTTAFLNTTATRWSANRLEQLMSADYDAVVMADTDGDGMAGINNTECCVGGNDAFGTPVAGCVAVADGCAADALNQYGIYWNVAQNQPLENMKTVRVSVARQFFGVTREVGMTYYRQNEF